MDDAEAYIRYAAPVCVRARTGRQVIPQIDAEIAEKGHLWMETNETEKYESTVHVTMMTVFDPVIHVFA